MAILRSLDGQFYEIPDDQVAKFLIPAEKVKEKLEGAGAPMVPPEGPPSDAGPGPGGPPPTILVQIFGAGAPAGGSGPPPTADAGPTGAGAEVQPYGHWNNWWHNRRGNWNNWWHNWHR